ncbi:MAG: type II toxin-antitoxin system PemK/MazF family toxin [Microcystis sp.]|jgi:mRNA-degrading endonuclease toxin of MazEF toxin-antitoxin module|uniref:type II toxin-antitoxin system PemK/MazF family toxin n=1 Tax=Microcystis TaxID=1125 RepID=UPI002245AE38|nr:type II toxin-antitoxin system PemK/MazF family toxin [Microcystis aeruginosa]NCQ93633.1 type II toxin-antitoxin system PemK/MazF family toxin [Microcystis aeruginosa LG13-13]NCR06749.1 type II toxin-antitoxin system PemK/MazF family toxin [Microcystis aeruginosa LG13-03]NCR64941.1 type II toxin-antitoxin system PemK/MazF family toxin [Microcystis aeruginosa LG11-05]NCR73893.1 type II toxin-antitoxin system PemK/MazF family toxin [Microcystis aeruginosa LG13-12]UZO77681.1 type II toxin-anti
MDIKRGEIIRINLNPISGREQAGDARPCLVLSHTRFNAARKGIVVVSPITSTIRTEIKTLIRIPDGFSVHGSVIAEQVRTVDLNSRWWKTTGEVLPDQFVDSVVETFRVIIG